MFILSFDPEKLKSNLNMIQAPSWEKSTENSEHSTHIH